MKSIITSVCILLLTAVFVWSADLQVTEIKAEHRNGQTFITWKDVAQGEEGGKYRYSVYRSAKPINSIAGLKPVMENILNNSGQMFGWAWRTKDRLKEDLPTALLKEGGEHLPKWSGVGVVTVDKAGKSFYAVAATENGKVVTPIVAGQSATVKPVDEKPGDIQPIKVWDSKKRKGRYIKQTCIRAKKNLPMMVGLHASGGYSHAGRSTYGDYYLYFSKP